MAVTESNIRVEPCDVYFGHREKFTVQTVADVSESLDGTYFTMYDADGTGYYVWMDIGVAADPAPAGLTAVPIVLNANDSAATVASGIQSAVDALAGFEASVSSDTVTITTVKIATSVTAAADVDTGFTVTQVKASAKYDLGGTSGGITVTPSQSKTAVQADQYGDTLLDEIIQGSGCEVSMSLLEMTASRWTQIIGGITGDELTPSGGTKITGYGESKRFTNMTQYAGELVLVPVSASDNSRNLHFWKSYPEPGSVNFSGTDLQAMELTWKCFRDSDKDTKINVFAFGDGEQKVNA